MLINTYLLFSGQCEAAFKFYEQCLNGKICSNGDPRGFADPRQVPPEWRNKILMRA